MSTRGEGFAMLRGGHLTLGHLLAAHDCRPCHSCLDMGQGAGPSRPSPALRGGVELTAPEPAI